MTACVDVIIDMPWTTLCTSCSGLRSIPAWLKYSRTARRTAGAALDGRQKVSFTISSGATAAYDASRWSLGKTKDAVHLRQQTDFRPRQKAKGERRSRRLSGAQRRFFCCVRLKQRHSCMVGKRFAGRRQLNTVSATIHQLNADFLFEITNCRLRDGWTCELLLGGNGQTARISNRDEVGRDAEAPSQSPMSRRHGPSLQSLFRPTSDLYSKKQCTRGLSGKQSASRPESVRPGTKARVDPYWSAHGKGITASLLLLLLMTGFGGAAAQSAAINRGQAAWNQT